MPELDDSKYNTALNNVLYLIREKTDLSKNSKESIEFTKEFFGAIEKSLDKILEITASQDIGMSKDLFNIINFFEKDKTLITFEEIRVLKKKFYIASKKLDILEANPYKFYNTKDSTEVSNLISGLLTLFYGAFDCN